MRRIQLARAPARRPRPLPAFLESVLPGLLGGVTSAMLGYPLELAETTLQARPATAAPAPARTRRARPPPPPSSSPTPALSPARVLADAWAADGAAGVLRGADMALLSALFGFGAFFVTAAAVGAALPEDAGLAGEVGKNVVAATAAQLANSPFQLLKTTAVLGGVSGGEAFRAAVSGGRGLRGLWAGLGGNMLGVVLVAAQFTLFQVMAAECVAVGGAPLAPATAGVVGAAACAGAAALTYPTVVLKTRVLAAAESARSCVLVDVGRELWTGGELYAGIGAFLARSVPPTGVLFAVQSFMEQSGV